MNEWTVWKSIRFIEYCHLKTSKQISYLLACLLTYLRTYLLTSWSFHLFVPPIVDWSAICCVTDLIAFHDLDLLLARLISGCFLGRPALTTSFHHNFGLPRDFGPSTLKLMIFFVHEISSCRCKWPDCLSLFHLRTFSIWWK